MQVNHTILLYVFFYWQQPVNIDKEQMFLYLYHAKSSQISLQITKIKMV